MVRPIALDAVTLVGIFVESVLYGLFILLYVISLFVLLRRKKNAAARVNRPMVAVSTTMFTLATIHVGVDLRRMLNAFLQTPDPVRYLSQVDAPIYVLKSTAYCIQTLVGDGFLLYRLYLVWNGDKRVVFPLLITFIAGIGVGIGALQAFARASPDVPVFISQLQHWIVSFFSLTLFTNFSCTFLIAARIWWIHRKIMGMTMSMGSLMSRGPSVVPAMVLIIESGAIYSACLVILLSLYLSGSFAQYIVLDSVTQVIGVVFSLVIVRVGLGLSSETTAAGAKSRLTFFSPDNNDTVTHTDRPGIQPHPMKHMVVRIMQDQTQDYSGRSEYDEGHVDLELDGTYPTFTVPAQHDGRQVVCSAEPCKEHDSGGSSQV